MPLTPEQAAAAAQDPSGTIPAPAEPVAPAVAQPAPSAGQGHPWDQDLSFIEDEAARSQVSDYLASKWQPRVTQLEQSSKQALELVNDFQEKPKDTYLEVTQELYGKDVATAVAQYLNELEGTPEATAPLTPPEAGEQPAIPSEVQAIIDWKREQDEKAAFDEQVERIKAANPGLELDLSLYTQTVAETGDFDTAVEVYRTKYGPYLEWRAAQANQPAPTEPTAPTPLGTGEATGAAEVQTQPQNQTLHEAIDDYFGEQAARGDTGAPAPPVVTAG